jgi:hypothetical protein
MDLSADGSHAGQLGDPEAAQLLQTLIGGGEDIAKYTSGVCYDVTAFCQYLGRRLGISADDLVGTSGDGWLGKFGFGDKWTGGAIDAGKAVGFKRIVDDKFFHAAVAVGGTNVRSVNGLLLGAGWSESPDIAAVLGAADEDGRFTYDNTKIEVYVA